MSDNRKLEAIADVDPIETQEWRESLDSVLDYEGAARAEFILADLNQYASDKGLTAASTCSTPYVNTIAPAQEAKLPDDPKLVQSLIHMIRWNAMVMVARANKKDSSLGGHIATYGSSADIFEMGLNYFFRGLDAPQGCDLIFFQGHASPGIYARAFLEGRLTEQQLEHFRREVDKKGLSSYPHPWLMPNFWQLPTVSMGLGPMMGIFQAQFLRYLDHRGLAKTDQRKVWVFCGDGEMGEPESLGLLNIAGREHLSNLVFVISCNLQRLDGPVWGNGQIIQEYESVFRGAGWHVIKVIWGAGWDELFAKDQNGILKKRVSELVDGEYQTYSAKDGNYFREKFFGKYPELLQMVADWSDEQLKALRDGGHDLQKLYAAYHMAANYQDKPIVILAKTIKGYGMGRAGEGLNITHNAKKMDAAQLKEVRTRFGIPLSDEAVDNYSFYQPKSDAPEIKFLHEQRKKLGGYLPKREVKSQPLTTPPLSIFEAQLQDSGDREFSSTMAYVRILSTLLKDPNIKEHIVPIVPDESRTFGMEGLFRQIGIYSPVGQLYEPEDRQQLMYYREDQKGQLMQQGLSEPAAMSSWIAAATSYASNNVPMIPFYIYYSMFGFQRVGDLVWAAADMRARGFLIGATAGRTTLNGEGLQHQDGHNLIMFGMVPNCVSYDPTFAYEWAVIVQNGLTRMYHNQEDVFYYITAMNENYHHPAMPKGAEEDIVKGLYLFKAAENKAEKCVQLLGSGTIFLEVIKAAEILAKYNVAADIWGAPGFNELRKDYESCERFNRLHPDQTPRKSHVQQRLEKQPGPVIAATDYMRLYAEQIRPAISQPYHVLGTDGFGRSDTRPALRCFFEVNAEMIAYTALDALYQQQKISRDELLRARTELNINVDSPDPWTV